MTSLLEKIFSKKIERFSIDQLSNKEKLSYYRRLQDELTRDTILRIFVIMPFGIKRLNEIYFEYIKIPLEREGHTVIRIDDYVRAISIFDNIIKNIKKADLIIAELTGDNLNVYYELGRAHEFGKDVVQICQINPEKLPFDIRGLTTVKYEDTSEGHNNLIDKIAKRINNIKKNRLNAKLK